MARRFAAVVLTLGCLHTNAVIALGLGELRLESFLNEPLTAEVDLLNVGGLHEDQIRVRLATSEDFEKLGVDRAYFLTSIKFKVVVDERGNGKIELSSDDPVLEPYLDFLIEARWPNGRLLREYTVLVDPPAFDTTSPVISATTRVNETEGVPDTPKKKTEEQVAASTGTRVKTHKSDLPPGQMPSRDYGSNASDTPMAGNQYMIRRDETLWAIALNAKPEGVSVHQTMLDIQRLNPDAFIDGNINRIKAGYIIYLPTEREISSTDLAQAQAEVRQQNQDWRDGVVRERAQSTGPTLRISADETPEQAQADIASGESEVSGAGAQGAAESLDSVERERGELSDRLQAMEEQVETLERIVSLKDEQIAALQSALSEAGESVDTVSETEDVEVAGAKSALDLARDAAQAEADLMGDEAATAAEPTTEQAPAVTPAPAPAPAAKPVAEEGGSFLTYIIGGLVAVALAVFFFLRRRGADEEEDEADTNVAPARDVFANVKLQDSEVQLDDVASVAPAKPAPVPAPEPVATEPEPAPEPEMETESEPEPEIKAHDSGDRGYGEHKHDEYASDESGDALAEADIYIAYGRYPQAIDLLKTAIGSEPTNTAYRAKLIELCTHTGDKEEAQQQYAQLRDSGDNEAVERAEDALKSSGNGSWLEELLGSGEQVGDASDELSLMSDIDLTADSGEALEDNFGGLEIETTAEDDLDLSADFADEAPLGDDAATDDEDLVFAEGGNEMSTKLDLARAYLDMGDEDGAKQILDEVVLEGSAGQQEEARVLLERIG